MLESSTGRTLRHLLSKDSARHYLSAKFSSSNSNSKSSSNSSSNMILNRRRYVQIGEVLFSIENMKKLLKLAKAF